MSQKRCSQVTSVSQVEEAAGRDPNHRYTWNPGRWWHGTRERERGCCLDARNLLLLLVLLRGKDSLRLSAVPRISPSLQPHSLSHSSQSSTSFHSGVCLSLLLCPSNGSFAITSRPTSPPLVSILSTIFLCVPTLCLATHQYKQQLLYPWTS